MSSVVWSPCTGRCVIQADVCAGCGRTMDEISTWRYKDNSEKQDVLDRLRGIRFF